MRYLTVLSLVLICFTACRKSVRELDTSTKASTDEVYCDNFLSKTFLIIDEAAKFEFGTISAYSSNYLSCATVTSSLINPTKTITIDFGSTGCTGDDGRIRKGVLQVTITNGNYQDPNAMINVNPVDFYVDHFKVEGSFDFTNKGLNANGKQYYKAQVNNIKLLDEITGRPIYWTFLGDFEQTSGAATTTDVSDDIYTLTGESDGTSRSGNTFSADITTGLSVNLSCKYIPTGKTTLTPTNLVDRELDFGSGECDSLVVATIHETQYVVNQE